MGRHKENYAVSRYSAVKIGILCFLVCIALSWISTAHAAPEVVIIDVQDAITPPMASFIIENIDEAAESNKQAVIIRMDTPGGLDTAMRDIIRKEMNAPVPVVVYVAPSGARAASAGAIIALASDIAAMAPGTNIGAAHPVGIGVGTPEESKDQDKKTMIEKATNDAVAYARSIARERGRNEKWAEDAVVKSISTPAHEALKLKVIDIVASDLDALLGQLDGRVVKKAGKTFQLNTKDAVVATKEMGLRYRLLATISNPNVAYILMLVGLAGIFFELASPGAILPGVIGGISLILAFFAFQTLTVNFAGVALIILAVILFIAEIKVPSFGMLTVGGVISMVLGSVLLFRTPEAYAQVSLTVILPITLLFTAFFVITLYLVIKTHRTTSVSGAEGLIGEKGEVYVWGAEGRGKVFCHGEYWNARGPEDLKAGDRVEVVKMSGMELVVKTVSGHDSGSFS